jgi:hypothetical protein
MRNSAKSSFRCNLPRQLRRFNLAILFIVGASFLSTASASAQQDDLSAEFLKAAESFRPVTDVELADAKAELNESMDALERFVRPTSQNGQRWLRYLRWQELKDGLAAEGGPDVRAMGATYQRLNRDEKGLELPRFRRVADALRRYNQLLQVARQEDQPQYYRSQLEALREQLDEYRREPSTTTEVQIGSRIGFLAELGRADELVAAIRQEFVRPNAFMEVSTALVASGADPINRREPVTDCILGVNIRSDASTTGTVAVASIPSEDQAVLEFISEGRTHSRNTGYKDPAVIRSTSYTDFTATKRVELSDRAFRSTSSRSNATTDTRIHSVAKQGGGFGSRIVSNIGWNRARQNERRAEAIAADHAEDRIDRNFNEELDEKIRDARQRYEDEYRRPLERRGELPDHIRFSSDKDSVNFEVAQANRGQLGAAAAPPDAPSDHDMTMRLHESAVNNYSASLLGGATASETEPDQENVKFDVTLPKWMKDAWENRKTDGEQSADAEFKPWSLKFRDGRPLSVDFADGKVKLTVHIARLTSGDESFANWDVTGTYTPELVDGGIVLRREGDLEMLPANFRGQLTSRQVAERRNLEEELNARSEQGRGFRKTIEFEAIQPEGDLADAGPLEYNQFDSDGGWLIVAWDRQSKR